MSVADKLNTLRSNIISAYDAVEAKSGTVPTYENTQGLANAISTIPQYNPLTLAYISYASAPTAQNFVNLMASNDTIPVGGASYAFAETDGLVSLDLSDLDFSNVTDTVCMFDNAADLATLTWDDAVDMGNVETMEGMYRGTTALTSVDLSKFATGEYLESVFNMFANSGVQSVNLGAPFDTSAVTDFYGMFNSCTSLTTINNLDDLDLSSAVNVGAMFYNCSALTSLDLSANAPDLSLSTTNADYMLAGMTSLHTLDLSGWKSGSDDLASSHFWDAGLLKITQYKGSAEQQSTPTPGNPQTIHTVTGEQTVSINGVDYPISLGSIELCKVGSFQDRIYKEDGKWYLEKKTGKVILTGQENWRLAMQDTTFYEFQASVFSPNALSGYSFPMSTHFSGETNNRIVSGGGDALVRVPTALNITSVAAFKTWLSNNNVTVYYELGTSTTTEITDATLLAQLNAISPYTADSTVTVSAVSPNLAAILATSSYAGPTTALTTLTLNGPKRLASGKLADSLVATFNSKQGSTITTLKLNDPEFFTTDGTTATLTDFSDVWAGSALTTLEMTGWDVSGVDPTDNSASVTLTSVANLTTLTIGNWTTPADGVNLATLLGVDSNGSNGYTGSATALVNLHITGSSVLKVYNSGTGEFKSSNAFAGCPIGNGTGHIYVPSSLVNSYKADSFWSAYASIITAES